MKTLCEILDNGGNYSDFYGQYKTATPELGKVYKVDDIGKWAQKEVKIVWIGEGIAVGVETKGLSVGSKTMYNSSGVYAGWVYNDRRAVYRLQELP